MAVTKKATKTAVPTELAAEGKKKALATAMSQIERDFGAGAIMKLGENRHMEVQAVHTGSLSLDMALGIGGVPKGRIVEIFGPESSGKTTVALHIMAEVQKAGGTAAFIDAEHALDPVYSKALGVDIDNLLVSQPDCGEDALEICEALARSGAVDGSVHGWRAGKNDVAGYAKAVRRDLKEQLRGDLYQPDPRKGWSDLRKSRNYSRRTRTEIFCVGAY